MLEVDIRNKVQGFDLDVTFSAPPGVTVLFGRSGSGKTSVAQIISGLLRPDQGRVALNGTPYFDIAKQLWVPPHKRQIGYVFQEGRLFPHLSVQQNLKYGTRFSDRGFNPAEYDKVVALLGLSHLLARRPNALSGGEKQRVAIGRALLASPRLLIADEPLASLDEDRKAEILPYFERLRDELDIPILYVSHAPAEVARLATTVVILRDGKVTRQGQAAEVLADPTVHPAGVRAAGSVIKARIKTHHTDGLTELDAAGVSLFLPHIDLPLHQTVRIRISAHDVMLARHKPVDVSALNIVPARIQAIHLGGGPGAMVSLDTAAGQILARITRRSVEAMSLTEGSPCYAVVKSVAIAPQDVG